MLHAKLINLRKQQYVYAQKRKKSPRMLKKRFELNSNARGAKRKYL